MHLFLHFYRIIANVYLLASLVVFPALCVLAWLLLAQVINKRLQPYVRWCLPLAIGATFSASSVLLLAFVTYFDRRNYGLASLTYLLILIGMPFHIVAFGRLWKMIANLPPLTGILPETGAGPHGMQNGTQEQPGVWPPAPRQ